MKFLVRKAPENFIRTVNDEISSLLNRHFDSYFPEAAYWEDMDKFSMPVEISDKGKDYEVKAELPGVKKEDLDIDIDKNYIVINAKKEEEKSEDEKSYKKSEFKYGEFSGERNGRYFTDMTEDIFDSILQRCPHFQIIEIWKTGDVRPGRHAEQWLNILLRKIN